MLNDWVSKLNSAVIDTILVISLSLSRSLSLTDSLSLSLSVFFYCSEFFSRSEFYLTLHTPSSFSLFLGILCSYLLRHSLSLTHPHIHREMDERGAPHLYQGFRDVRQRMEKNSKSYQNTYCCPNTHARPEVFFKIDKSQTERRCSLYWWKSIRDGRTKGPFLSILWFYILLTL